MALLNYRNDFSDDEDFFKEKYDMGFEEFIKEYGEYKIIIDLKDKIVVSVESIECDEEKRFPVDVLALLVPEGEKYGYKASLIYTEPFSFIKIEYLDGHKRIFYKGGECIPQDVEDFLDCSDIFFDAEDYGFKKEDVFNYIELKLKADYDFNFKLDKDKLVILEGL